MAEFCLYGCGSITDYERLPADEVTTLVATTREINMAIKKSEANQLLAGIANMLGMKK